MFAYDAYLCRQSSSDFNAFNLDNIDEAFAQITPLRYQQTISLNTQQTSGSGAGEETTITDSDSIIKISPYAAGRMVGGSIWKIEKAGEEYVYAIDYNHKKERHLLGTVLESAFSRPTLLITDAWNALAPNPPPRSHMESALLDTIMTTLRRDGNVLMPVDTAGRVLELLLIVERHWSELKLTYPLVFLSTMAYNTLEFAKSQLEWMNDELTRLLGHSKDNAFVLKHVVVCSSTAQLKKMKFPKGVPKLVLATLPSLEAGPARELFAQWAGDERNTILFPTEPEVGSLAEKVLGMRRGGEMQLLMGKRVQLEGEELEKHKKRAQENNDVVAGVGGVIVEEEGEDMMDVDVNSTKEEGDTVPASDNTSSLAVAEKNMATTPIASSKQQQQPPPPSSSTTAANTATIANKTGDGGRNNTTTATSNRRRVSSIAIGYVTTKVNHKTGEAEILAADGTPLLEKQGANPLCIISTPSKLQQQHQKTREHIDWKSTCLREGFEFPEDAVGPMFPDEDDWEKVVWDEYGAPLELLLTPEGEDGGDGGVGVGGTGVGGGGYGGAQGGMVPLQAEFAAQEKAEEEYEEEIAIPTKIVTKLVTVTLQAQIVKTDFNGRVDGRSMKTMLSRIAPRRCVIIHGTEEASATLQAGLKSELEGLQSVVVAPALLQEMHFMVEPSYPVMLMEAVLDNISMHNVGEYRIGWVDAVLGKRRTGDGDIGNDGGEEQEEGGSFVLLPLGNASAIDTTNAASVDKSAAAGAGYGGVFIGDVKLSELKKALELVGIPSEFYGGALHCAGKVVITRRGGGGGGGSGDGGYGLSVEGALCSEYYKVREVAYSLYHIA
jgi:Cft2 family RNA processing exonuclease